MMVDAYRSESSGGVVLHYCLKCFTTFLANKVREEHDETHKNQSDKLCPQIQNVANVPLLEKIQSSQPSFNDNNTYFVISDS